MNQDFIWIGINGYTASIGQWIREVADKIDNEQKVYRGFRWYTTINIHDKQTDAMWYFGIELGTDEHKIIYACGGCTDFSGEGERGRQIANHFLQKLVPEQMIIERNSDYLISLLTSES